MRRSHRTRHFSNGHRHRKSSTENYSYLEDGPNGFDNVQSWLNKVHDFEGPKDSEEHFAKDAGKGYTSNWKPHNLPVTPIPPNHHQLHHSRNQSLYQNRVSTPSEFVEDDAYSESQDNHSLDTRSDKENNKKRSRSHLYQDSPDDTSRNHRFERQPRRKTRPDRYVSKNKTSGRKVPIESEAERRPRKKSRSKKHEIRSSLDVMNNFVSGAIPNTRVTMRPNLTAGLFLNGRSSTYGHVADLTFNDMTFMETWGGMGKGNEKTQLKGDESSRDIDGSSEDGQSSQRHTKPPAATANDKEKEDQQARSKTAESRIQHLTPKKDQNTHDGLGSSKEITNTSDSETPETILKKLIETSIFDGTGILKRVWDKDNLGIFAPAQANKSPSYQDEGVMAKSSRNLPIKSSTQLNAAEFAHKDAANCAAESTEGLHPQCRKELPLSTSDVTGAQILALPRPLEHPTDEQLTQDPEAKRIHGVNYRRQSVSQTSEGGHYYIRCLDQNDQLGHMPPNLETDLPWIEQLLHRDTAKNVETEALGLFARRGWQLHNDTMTPPGPYSHQHGAVHNSVFHPLLFPTTRSEIYPPQNETQHGDNAQSRQSYYYDDEETIHEFINRIEDEVSSRRDEPLQRIGDSHINDIEEYNEAKFLGVHGEPNQVQSSNPGHHGEMQSSLHDIYPSSRQGPAPESQTVPEYRRVSGCRQDGHSTGRTHDEYVDGVSDAEMVAFWRPNRF